MITNETKKGNLTMIIVIVAMVLVIGLGALYIKNCNPRYDMVGFYYEKIAAYLPDEWDYERKIEQYGTNDMYTPLGRVRSTYEIFYVKYDNGKGSEKSWRISTVNMWFGENEKNYSADRVFAESVIEHIRQRTEEMLNRTRFSMEGADDAFRTSRVSISYDNTENEIVNNAMGINLAEFGFGELAKMKNVKVAFSLEKKDGVSDDVYEKLTDAYMAALKESAPDIEFVVE